MKGLDCLINNASIFENDNLENFSEKSFTKHMNINLKAPAIMAQNFKRLMSSQILRGAIDNHIHCCPHINKRSTNIFEVVRYAEKNKMHAIGLMDNF